MKDDSFNQKYDKLRTQAEKRVSRKPVKISDFNDLTPEEILRFVHELKVHKTELEMQNDELRRVQLELETSRARYFNSYELAPVGYITLDNEGIIINANLTCARILRMERGDMTGKPFTGFIATDDQDTYYLFRKRLFKTGGHKSCEIKLLRSDGISIWIRLDMSPEEEVSNDTTLCLAVITDISERKQAEDKIKNIHLQLEQKVEMRTRELKKANKLLQSEITERKKMEKEIVKADKLEFISALAGGIAHDFNNYLAALTGNISLAMYSKNNPERIEKYLNNMEKATLTVKDLTYQLFNFAKGENSVKKSVFINDLVNESTSFALSGSAVSCKKNLPEDLHPVKIDVGLITQVFYNIIINAVQAMPEGGTMIVQGENISVEAAREKFNLLLPEGEYVKISITDDGPGIPVDILHKIFDPFFTTKQNGNGLGLAGAYSIIRNHDGYITAESEKGGGATFSIYLPATGEEVVPDTKEDDLVYGTGKILIMDDEENIRNILGEMLSHLGYNVCFCKDGDEAIEKYRDARRTHHPFDLIVMDLTIPGGMGGKETINQLRNEDPSVKAIISSGYSENVVLDNFSVYGFNGAVRKPYTIVELSKTVAEAIR